MSKITKIIYGVFVVLFIIVFIILANTDDNIPSVSDTKIDILASGWSDPIKLAVNSNLWEDGAFISGDGNTIYFAVYQGDLINDVLKGDLKPNIEVYFSQKPFTNKQLYSISEPIYSEGGVMISGNDVYYMSNKDTSDGKYDTDIYKNGIKMPFSTSEDEDDPHYCALKDELYFWKGDGDIYVYKNNAVVRLSSPINSEKQDIQPFLTPDCNTMYFSSDREGTLAIYRAERIGDNEWSSPIKLISSQYGVGEPTLTDDGRKIFFVVLSKTNERYDSDIYYIEKL